MDMKKYKLIIFDMDGTILNSLEDITDSINYVLSRNSMPVHDVEAVKFFVGNGLHKLVERAVPKETDSELIEKIYEEFLPYYKEHCHIKTRPYDGILELISELRKRGYYTAVATNKSDDALRELLNIHFKDMFDCAVGVKPGIAIKPDACMVDIILKELGLAKEDALYIGDSNVDIMTAVNSKIDHIEVSWGFRSKEFLRENGSNTIIDYPLDLLKMV